MQTDQKEETAQGARSTLSCWSACLLCCLMSCAASRRIVPRCAPWPFDDPNANVIIRSCDGFDFYVEAEILTRSSPFFRRGLSQPAPAGRRLLPSSAASTTLNILLRFCYPGAKPTVSIGETETFYEVLKTAGRYEIQTAKTTLLTQLSDSAAKMPWEVLIIAARSDLQGQAEVAADQLRTQWTVFNDEDELFEGTLAGRFFAGNAGLCRIVGGVYFRLLRYIRNRSSDTNFSLSAPASNDPQEHQKRWAIQPPFNRDDHDVTLISSDGVGFATHELLLRLAGLEEPWNRKLKVHSAVLGPLLRLCYPADAVGDCGAGLANVAALGTRTFGDVLEATITLGMQSFTKQMRAAWIIPSYNSEDLLGMYCIAARLKFALEERFFASELLARPIANIYSPELERTTADIYQRLLMFHHKSNAAMLKVYRRFEHTHETAFNLEGRVWREAWFEGSSGRFFRSLPLVLAETHDVRAEFREGRQRASSSLERQVRELNEQTREALEHVSHLLQMQTTSASDLDRRTDSP